MSFEIRFEFPNVARRSLCEVNQECERLEKAGWFVGSSYCVSSFRILPTRNEPVIQREIQQLYLAEVHWNQRFLDLEPTEIGVVFQNSLFPSSFGGGRFLDTHNVWERYESHMLPGFWYEICTNSERKTLEIRVSGGQQLGKENLKKFLLTLSSYYTATKVARELYQFRMAAGKAAAGENCVPEMDRHYAKILETLGTYLPR